MLNRDEVFNKKMFQKSVGGALTAPPYLGLLQEDSFLWAMNTPQIDPLFIIGIGDYGESVLHKFKDFTKYYRTGFSWDQKSLLGMIIPNVAGIDTTERGFLKLSLDCIENKNYLTTRFLSRDNLRCVIIFDLTDTASFGLLKELLFFLDELRTKVNRDFPVSIIASVEENLREDLGIQSARLRTITMWQQNARHDASKTRQSTLLDHAFLLKKDSSNELTINKAVLCLYSVFHSKRPLEHLVKDERTFAMDLRAIYTPYEKLLHYEAIGLTKSILFDQKDIFFHDNSKFDENVGIVSLDQSVIELYRKNLHTTKNQEKLTLIQNLLGIKNDLYKWEKVYLLVSWLELNEGDACAFAQKISHVGQIFFEKLEESRKSTLRSLNESKQDPLIRWIARDDMQEEIESLSNAMFTNAQLELIKTEASKKISFIVDENLKIKLCFSSHVKSSNHTTGMHINADSGDDQIIAFLHNIFAFVYSRLETELIRYLDGFPIRYLDGFPKDSLVVNDMASQFLVQIPDAVPGKENNKKYFLSSPVNRPQDIINPLMGLESGEIVEPGLAIVVLGETEVDYKSYPSQITYKKRHIEDTCLENAFSLERDWSGNLLHEFSPKTLVYMKNIRAVKLFFEALHAGAIFYDDYEKSWIIEGFHPDGENVRLSNLDQEDTLDTLVKAFQFFVLDGIEHQLGTLPFSTVEAHEDSLGRLERYLRQPEAQQKTLDWIERLVNGPDHLLIFQKTAEQNDFTFLYNYFINR